MSYLTHFCCESEQLGRYAILTQSPTHAKAIAEKSVPKQSARATFTIFTLGMSADRPSA